MEILAKADSHTSHAASRGIRILQESKRIPALYPAGDCYILDEQDTATSMLFVRSLVSLLGGSNIILTFTDAGSTPNMECNHLIRLLFGTRNQHEIIARIYVFQNSADGLDKLAAHTDLGVLYYWDFSLTNESGEFVICVSNDEVVDVYSSDELRPKIDEVAIAHGIEAGTTIRDRGNEG